MACLYYPCMNEGKALNIDYYTLHYVFEDHPVFLLGELDFTH